LRESNYSRDASKTGTTAPADTTVVLIPDMPETVRKSATLEKSEAVEKPAIAGTQATAGIPCRVPTAHCQQWQQQQGWQLQRQEENSRDDSSITAPIEGAARNSREASSSRDIKKVSVKLLFCF
jgi:hypothetical protein